MTRRKRRPAQIDVRAVLESPVARIGGGRSIGAFEAAMRRAAEKGSAGNMTEARRFIGPLIRYGLLEIAAVVDDHQYVLRIPKDWDREEWMAMYNKYGPPPWPGEHDGLIPADRWRPEYGPRPQPLRRRTRRK